MTFRTSVANAEAIRADESLIPAANVLGLAVAGTLACAVTIWLGWHSPIVADPKTSAVVKGLLVASYVAVGTWTWWQRPSSRLGPLIALTGLLYTFAALTADDRPFPYTVGRLALAVAVVYLLYLFLSFPAGRLASPRERKYVAVAAAASALVWAAALPLAETLPHGGGLTDCIDQCPDNPLWISAIPHFFTPLVGFLVNGVTALLVAGVVVLLARKCRSLSVLRRRAVAPVLWASILVAVTYGTYTLASQANADVRHLRLWILSAVGLFAVPLCLIIGQSRGRLFAAANLWQALEGFGSVEATPSAIEEFLRGAIGDPTFSLAIWQPELNAYSNTQGKPVTLPERSFSRGVITIEGVDGPRFAMIHDPWLDEEPEILRGLGATATMLLENANLIDQLQQARARLVGSAETERLRLEHDLHESAQQELLAVQIKLALARERTADPELLADLDELAADVSRATEEIRRIASGIYPAMLRERGLADALLAFGDLTPVPIDIDVGEIGRVPEPIEAAIYYCATQAIQNAVKHGGRGVDIKVTLRNAGARLDLRVEDSGEGFDPAEKVAGSGLTSMRDRIEAVGGTLEIESNPGRGALVRATVAMTDPV